MKLTPAEEWNDQHGTCPISIIRQIQSNALRWAFDQHVTVEGYAAIIEKANQLDPLPEAKPELKPLNMDPGPNRSSCCNSPVQIEGTSEGTGWYSCNKCGEACDIQP